MLAVNAWDEPKEMIQEFAKSNNLNYPILLDGQEVFRKQYGGKPIPHNFLIDKKGQIVWSHLGWDASMVGELEQKIEELLRS